MTGFLDEVLESMSKGAAQVQPDAAPPAADQAPPPAAAPGEGGKKKMWDYGSDWEKSKDGYRGGR